MDRTNPYKKPDALMCPVCRDVYPFEWDGEEWMVDAEWWRWGAYDFLCSRRCWIKARREIDDRDVRVEEFRNAAPTDESTFAIRLVHTPSGLVVFSAGRLKDSYSITRETWEKLHTVFTAWKNKESGTESTERI
jgi:hypothetical protein